MASMTIHVAAMVRHSQAEVRRSLFSALGFSSLQSMTLPDSVWQVRGALVRSVLRDSDNTLTKVLLWRRSLPAEL